MKKVAKTRDQKIREAVDVLNKAMQGKEPHIQIDLQVGIDGDDPRGQEFVKAIKTFVEAYAKFYGMDKKKINLNFVL